MRELEWLGSLAPEPPPVEADQRGNLQLLEIIQENTEYPFWSAAKESLVAPAQGNHALGHGCTDKVLHGTGHSMRERIGREGQIEQQGLEVGARS